MIRTGLILTILLICAGTAYPAEAKREQKNQQTPLIKSLLAKENNARDKHNLNEILTRLDNTYARLYDNLKDGKKLVVFFDPAHGKLSNGVWQGAATRRMSSANLPEEYYSILISRKMYQLLSRNRYIEVKTTRDFMDVLTGKSDTYRNIPFSTTVSLAKKHGAFIIIAEHLNNVSMIHKASGTANIPGVHVIYNQWGNRFLKYVHGSYKGFLTLYNKLDASGFSRQYALKLKKKLVAAGMKPNSWEFGAVGDSRFSYFVDFPVSVIYESGFISNPIEEKQLRDPEHIEKLVTAQYESLLDTINMVFNVNLEGEMVKKTGALQEDRLELLKLSRMAVYYIKNGKTSRGIATIRAMERKYGKSRLKTYVYYYSGIRSTLERYARYRRLVAANNWYINKYTRLKRKYAADKKKAAYYAGLIKMHRHKRWKYTKKSRNCISRAPIFTAYRSGSRGRSSGRSSRKYVIASKVNKFPVETRKASLDTPVIFPVDEDQSLEDAIIKALDPSEEILKKLTASFRKSRTKFSKGIYIVKLNKKLKVVSASRVRSVHLNPKKYQNHEYLKNSCFGSREKIKEL